MGCSSSDAHVQSLQIKSTFPNIMITKKKPSVWLIGGGPGCEKGKICEYLIRDYKFKYLSSYDMVQFQQERGGADAELILRLFKEKKKMPSDLIVRLVKKAIASCGIRRFLIDGFPNSIQDVSQFDKQLTEKQINFYGYLNIKISQKKMIQSGIQAFSEDKSKQKADIQLNVREIVKIYQNQSEKIKKQYQKKNKYHQIDGQQGGDKTYVKVKGYLQSLGIQQLKPVHVFFSHFDDISHQTIFCDNLARKYGIYIYSPRQLISEALSKSYTTQGQVLKKLQKQNKQVPPSIVLSLIRKKIQKQDYRGRFLFAGYPRNISDAQEWDKHFGWETDILGYLSFQIPNEKFRKVFTQVINKSKPNLKSQQINKQFEKYQSNQKQICGYYQKQNKLLLIDAQNQHKALTDIHRFFQQKNIFGRKKISMTKLVFMSTLCGNGSIYAEIAQKRGAKVLKMQNIMQQKIDQNGLYSQLIQSFIKIGKPVSGAVVSRILVQKIMQQKIKNLILIEGFPNSQQQLQSWQQQVGQCFQVCLLILYSHNSKFIQQKVKQKIKDKKIMAQQKDVIQLVKQNSIKIQQKLKKSNWKYHIVNPLDDPSKIQGIFDNSGFK